MFSVQTFSKVKTGADKRVAEAFERAMTIAAGVAIETARALAPRKTGRLQSRIYAVMTPKGFKLVADVPYAGFMELGTRPHVIHAKKGKRLVFTVGGRKVFATKVNHPGTAPRLFIRGGMLAAKEAFQQALRPGLRKAVR